MSDDQYNEKFNYFLARDLKCQFVHEKDIKFRFGPNKYQFFHCHLPVIMNTLNKNSNKSLKEFLFGESSMNFEFSPEFLEAKQEFMMFHSLQVQRTEKNANAEYEYFGTTCDNAYMYSLGLEDGRVPLRDHYRL